MKAITSQYDNIECSNYISAVVDCKDQEELNEKQEILRKKLFQETEKDIKAALQNLMEMANDSNNELVMGNGTSADDDDKYYTLDIDGLDELATEDGESTEVVSLGDFEEVDMDKI